MRKNSRRSCWKIMNDLNKNYNIYVTEVKFQLTKLPYYTDIVVETCATGRFEVEILVDIDIFCIRLKSQ